MKKIAIDMATIFPGKGGAGGGINTYARNLLINLDEIPHNDCKILCLANTEFDLELKNIEIVKFNIDTRSYYKRMIYIHIILPFFCLRNKITVLHKLASEVPLFLTSDLVVTVHDFLLEYYIDNNVNVKTSLLGRLKNWYFLAITIYAIKKAKCIITPSNTIREEAMSRYRIDEKKIVVAELAAQIPAFVKRRKKKDTVNIFYIAAFLPHKGHLKAIEIFEILRSKHNIKAKLFFRGNRGDENVYKNFIERVNGSIVKEDIKVIDYDKSSSLTDIYAEADCIWLFSDYEGFGLPLLEAQAYKVPVICTDIPVFEEVLGTGSGLILNGDNDQMSNQIAQFLSNTSAQENLVKLGSLNVSRYNWMLFANKIAEVYLSRLT